MPALLPSELPVRCRTRQHWIILFAVPHKWPLIAFAVLAVLAYLDPDPFLWIVAVVVVVVAVLRWWTWRADYITLTGKRVIRTQGIPEISSAESSLRLDRISGLRIVETLWGNLLGYASIELEAPGEHPGVRKLTRIADAHDFYLALRSVIFGERGSEFDEFGDPDPRGTAPGFTDTTPLPQLPPPPPQRDRFGRDTDRY